MKGRRPLQEIRKNAERLLSDAELLFSNERYPSCRSMAILCLEECVKFLYYKSVFDPTIPEASRLRFSHKERYRYFGLFMFMLGMTSMIEWMPKIAAAHPLDKKTARAIEQLTAHLRKEHDYRKPETLRGIIVEYTQTERFKSIERHIQEVDKKRQQGFYVDLDEFGRVSSSPAKVSATDAKEWLHHARVGVAIAFARRGSAESFHQQVLIVGDLFEKKNIARREAADRANVVQKTGKKLG
ncbi:MAG: AbiV family abortive infection protein [Alphaproteobacteria bacterium]|nr:AbiV family abortive infection protein [Alphaproteobacteria bacterium]